MKPKTLEAAKQHALECFPRESCGLVVVRKGKESYVPCRNVAVSPSEHFVIHERDYDKAEEQGKVTAIVHSHPNEGARASESDKVACENSGLEWYIIAVHLDAGDTAPRVADVSSFKPSGFLAPLVGRDFAYGTLDCYTLVQDWYERERGIKLMDAEGQDGWWNRGENLYMKNFKKAGFEAIAPDAEFEVGDIILMQIRSPNDTAAVIDTNHAAIYIGNGRILHHLYGRLSSRDMYGGYWREVTRVVIRHRRGTDNGK